MESDKNKMSLEVHTRSIDFEQFKNEDALWQKRYEPLLWQRRKVGEIACDIEDIIVANDNECSTPEIEKKLHELSIEQQRIFRGCLGNYFVAVQKNKLIEVKLQEMTIAGDGIITPETLGRRYFYEKKQRMPLGVVQLSRNGGIIQIICHNEDDAIAIGKTEGAAGVYCHGRYLWKGSQPPKTIIRDYEGKEGTIVHEKRHFIQHQVLNLFHRAHQKGFIEPVSISRSTETTTEIGIKDEIIAHFLRGSSIKRIRDFLASDLYKHLFKGCRWLEMKPAERKKLDLLVERVLIGMEFLEKDLPNSSVAIANNPHERRVLAYQLAEIPLSQWPMWLGHLMKFYFKNGREIISRPVRVAKISRDMRDVSSMVVHMPASLEAKLPVHTAPSATKDQKIMLDTVVRVADYCEQLAAQESLVLALGTNLSEKYAAIKKYTENHFFYREGDLDYYTKALEEAELIEKNLAIATYEYDRLRCNQEVAQKYVRDQCGIADEKSLKKALAANGLFLYSEKKKLLQAAANSLLFAKDPSIRRAQVVAVMSKTKQREEIHEAIRHVFERARTIKGEYDKNAKATKVKEIIEGAKAAAQDILNDAATKNVLTDDDIRNIFAEKREKLYKQLFVEQYGDYPPGQLTNKAQHAACRALVADTARTHEMLINACLKNDSSRISQLEEELKQLRTRAWEGKWSHSGPWPQKQHVAVFVQTLADDYDYTHEQSLMKISNIVQSRGEIITQVSAIEGRASEATEQPILLFHDIEKELANKINKENLLQYWPSFRDSPTVRKRLGNGDETQGAKVLARVDKELFKLQLKFRDHDVSFPFQHVYRLNTPEAVGLCILASIKGGCTKKYLVWIIRNLEESLAMPRVDKDNRAALYVRFLDSLKSVLPHVSALNSDDDTTIGDSQIIEKLQAAVCEFVEYCLKSNNADMQELAVKWSIDFTSPSYEKLVQDYVAVYQGITDEQIRSQLGKKFSPTMPDMANEPAFKAA